MGENYVQLCTNPCAPFRTPLTMHLCSLVPVDNTEAEYLCSLCAVGIMSFATDNKRYGDDIQNNIETYK